MTEEQKRRINDHRPAVGLQWDENSPPPRVPFDRPEQWTILLTSGNHGLVGSYGHTFPHAEGDHERINVVDEAVVIKLRERIRELEAAVLSHASKAVMAEPVGYARESELEKLADKRISGVGMMIHKEAGEGKVAVYLAAPAPADNPSTESDIEWAARHLMPFSGKKAADNPSTAGAAKGGITSLDSLTRYSEHWSGVGMAMDPSGEYVLLSQVERLLAAPALNPSDVRDHALEEAASICDLQAEKSSIEGGRVRAAACAHKIRALKGVAAQSVEGGDGESD